MAAVTEQLVGRSLPVRSEIWDRIRDISNSRNIPIERVLSRALFGVDDVQISVDATYSYGGMGRSNFYVVSFLFPTSKMKKLGIAADDAKQDLDTYMHDGLERFSKRATGDKTPVRQEINVTLRIHSSILKVLQRRAEAQNMDISGVMEKIVDGNEELRHG